MSISDSNEAGIFPVAATVPVLPVFLPVILPVVFLPVFFPFWLLVFLEGLILEDERGEDSVLKIFGLLILDASPSQEAVGILSIGPGLEPAANLILEGELVLRSSGWIGAPLLTFLLGVGKPLGIK